MYAIIETGGKQYRVEPGEVLRIEKVEVPPGELYTGARVLAVGDGESLQVGRPALEGAEVRLRVLRVGKGRKILVFKYKPKKNYRRRYGHRQPFSEVKVESIDVNSPSPVATTEA